MASDDPRTRPHEPGQAPPPAGPGGPPAPPASGHPLEFDVEYPDRDLNRLTTAFRIFTVIPIAIVLASIGGTTTVSTGAHTTTIAAGGSGLLVIPPLLMILFRQKYPRWWYDFNLELLRFENRVGVYLALMDDRYPSTDEPQSVRLDVPYPDAKRLNRWLPLVKWLLAIPHYVVLFFLYIGALFAVIAAWFAILFTDALPARHLRLPRGSRPLDEPGDGLRSSHGHRRVPAVPAAAVKAANRCDHHAQRTAVELGCQPAPASSRAKRSPARERAAEDKTAAIRAKRH